MRFGRRLGLAMILAAAAVPLAGGAHASELSASAEARSTMRRTLSCIVDNDMKYCRGRGLFAVMEGRLGDQAFAELRANLHDCLVIISHEGRSVRRVEFTPALLKGQIFRSIVLDDWGVTSRRELLPEFRRIASAPQEISKNPIGVFGTCVAGLDPENARKAIGSRTADDEEAAAYAALAPFMSQCVAPGNQIAFSKQVLEGALAEGLFMVTFSAPSTSPVVGAN